MMENAISTKIRRTVTDRPILSKILISGLGAESLELDL